MEYKNIIITKEEEISIITVNRPSVLNALNDETISELICAFKELDQDANTKVVILTGAGDKAFVAGADINELKTANSVGGLNISKKGQSLTFIMEGMSKPIIAAINGYALGGGCELAMACDIRIAVETAKLGQPEVNLGLIPGYGGTQRLTKLVGQGRAMELILTGSMIDANEAYRIGLVNKVTPPDKLMETAKDIAKKIASKAPIAITLAKQCILKSMDVDIKTGCEYEASQFGVVCSTEDKNEGTSAFIEKRKANFKGK